MRILISGYYGFHNTGDEAVLAGIVAGLRRRLPDAELCVLSADPPGTAAQHGVLAADRWRTPVIWSELRKADFFIQGGGSLLQDVTSPQSPVYYLGLLHLARLTRTPYMIFAQGIGPISSNFLRGITARNLRSAKAITVRDIESAQMLRDWGVNKPEVVVSADPGLLVEPSDDNRRRQLLRSMDLAEDQPFIAIALREWPGLHDFLPHLVELLRRRDEALLVLPLHYEQDLPLALDLSQALPNRVHLPHEVLSPADSMALVRGARAVIAMRLHAMIFAAAQYTPAIGISYDPKVDAFCRQSGHPVLQLHEVTTERLEECLQQTLGARTDEAAIARIETLKHAAEVSFDVLLSVLPS
ncbi:MAG: polysaccharide pyruvyl transferase CsaB [Armatimonadia bacterium]